jgi:hydroxypyruvate isomerase
MRLSANLGFLWPDLPVTARIAAAARAGFAAVELHWPYDVPAADLAQAADDAGLRILALNSPRGDLARGENGIACLPGREAEFAASMTLALSYARTIGAGAVHVMAGKPADSGWTDRLVANLRHAADMAGDLTILLEGLNAVDAPGYAYATMDAADAIRRAVDRPNVALMLDAYHEFRGGLDPADSWGRHRDHVGHVQIAGCPGRQEPAPASPPLAGFLAALQRDGYAGWIGAEYRPAGDTDAGMGWRAALAGQA